MLCLILVFGSCRKKAFDAYYGRPSTLAPPIYQVLQSRGNFTNLLKVIDKSGYKATLSAAGYWTFFAPNDDAFKAYFASNTDGITSIDQITDSIARSMVAYGMVYNAFQTDHISDYQSTLGWVPGTAFKRRTAYYDGFKNTDKKPLPPNNYRYVYVSQNRNAAQTSATPYVFGDNNNKFIPYFYSLFMNTEGLTAADYNYFWPNTPYTGFNVVDGSVVNPNILAENGVIHEVDHVLRPLKSVEQLLAKHTEDSFFKKLFDNFLITYTPDASYTNQYNVLTHKSDSVYVKTYPATLPYSLGNENYGSPGVSFNVNDAQTDGYTLFAPKNSALKTYIRNSVTKYYSSSTDTSDDAIIADLKKMPASIPSDLLRSHMFLSTVWPSKFATITNSDRENTGYDPNDVTQIPVKEFGSNGIFYGVNSVHKPNVFNTVYGRAYLDSTYSMMLVLMNTLYKTEVTIPSNKFTLFAIPNAVFRNLGYTYNTQTSTFTLTQGASVQSGAVPLANLERILAINTIHTPNNDLDDLSGDGTILTYQGEAIGWHHNTVFSGANVEASSATTTVRFQVSGHDDYVNGRIYYLTYVNGSEVLNSPQNTSPPVTIASEIAKNAGTTADPYYDFNQYLINSTAYNIGGKEIIGVQAGAHYTVLVPTHDAIVKAIQDGILPGTVTAGVIAPASYKPTSVTDQLKVNNFIYYHILLNTFLPNGKSADGSNTPNPEGYITASSMLKDINGQPYPVYIHNPNGTITNGVVNNFYLVDAKNGQNLTNATPTATLIQPNNGNSFFPATSNYLGDGVVFHQINSYLNPNISY